MRTMKITSFFKVIASSLFLLASLLGSVAWYIVSKYQLPFSTLPIITIFLGPIDFFTTYRSVLSLPTSRKASKRPLPPLLLFLNLLLLILPTVIIALGAPYLGESKCQLQETWQSWYSAHDGKAIKGVQDALQCCGFGKVGDKSYPFFRNPSKDKKDPGVPSDTCSRVLERSSPCAPLWQGELKTAAGLVVAAGGLMVVLRLIFLMIALGNPRIADKWFARQNHSGYNDHRVIEEVNDDEPEEEEAPAPHITTAEGPNNETGANEGTRLLLPKDHGRNGHQITMHDENAWRS